MSQLPGFFDLLAPFFGIIALGFAAGRLAGLPAAGLAWMHVFLVYLALPCLFFQLLADKPIAEVANWRFVGLTTLATALVFLVGLVATRLRTRHLPEATIGGVSAAYSNIGYMGPPLVISFLGQAASTPVVLIFLFDTIFLFTVVPTLMAVAGVERRSFVVTAAEIARRVLLHPFLIATAIGLLASAFQWRPPEAAGTMIRWLAGASAPCALFTLGVTVALQPVGRMAGIVSVLVGAKLLLHPLVVAGILLGAGGFDPVWLASAIVMAALPPALNIFVLASQYRAGIERASACVLAGTVVSIVTLPVVLWLLRSGLLGSPG